MTYQGLRDRRSLVKLVSEIRNANIDRLRFARLYPRDRLWCGILKIMDEGFVNVVEVEDWTLWILKSRKCGGKEGGVVLKRWSVAVSTGCALPDRTKRERGDK